MAEHQNAALIRMWYKAFAEGNYPPIIADLLAEDVVWHLPGRHPLSGDHRGRDAVMAAILRFDELSASLHLEVHDVLASDEHAVALLRATGTREGKRYDGLEIDVFHIRGGRVTEFWSFSEDTRLNDEFWS
jgi:ketosteroid isomerase-like protein